MTSPPAFSRFSWRSKRLWLIFGLLLGLALIGLVFKGSGETSKLDNSTPVWRGIVPGKTTQWDVLSLMGRPDEINKCHISGDRWNEPRFPDDVLRCFSPILTYKYKEVRIPGKPPAEHEVRFKFATVWAVVEDMWLSPDESSPQLLEKYVRKYGQPERVTWSKRSPYERAFLFCEHGIMVHANQANVGEIFYFVPIQLKECLREFGDDIATEDPFPDPQFPSIENPWPWLIPNN